MRRRTIKVLNGVDMELPQGAKLAIIGRTGVGKSTLMKILARLYQPVRGSVQVMGNPVNQIPVTDQLVYMEQEPKVMGGTIRMQLTMGLMNDACVTNPLKLFREMCALQEKLEDAHAERKTKKLTHAQTRQMIR
jgi:ATP-binding cassette subfamily C protein LapB